MCAFVCVCVGGGVGGRGAGGAGRACVCEGETKRYTISMLTKLLFFNAELSPLRSPHSEHRFPAPSSKLLASLSGTFRQTPSIAFRHLPPNSEYRFPAPSSKLRASLSSTFLQTHTPSIAFLHLPPNPAIFGYATEGALFISAQLSTDAVSALRMVWVL